LRCIVNTEDEMGRFAMNQNPLAGPSRRSLLAGAAAVSALGIDAGVSRVLAQGAGPIRIGILNTFTKAGALYGEATWRGAETYLDQVGGRIAGRQVQLIREDDEFNPQAALQKVRKLVESDKVHVLLGPLGSHIATAMADYMKQARTPWLVTGAGATALTKLRIPTMYRATLTNWQVAHPMGAWAAKNGVTECVVIASDFLAGHDVSEAFKGTFVAGGGKIIKEIYPPVGTNDFSAYVTDVRSMNAQAVYGFFIGSEAGRFVRQFQQFGLKGKVKLLGFQSMLDSDTFPLQGNSALGGLSSSIYCETLDTPENKHFVDRYSQKHKDLPGIFTESGYTTLRIIDEAVKSIGGNIEDANAFATAVGKTDIAAPRGPIRFDQETHQAIQNVYIREVVEKGGKLVNQVVDVVPRVGDNPANKA
jgi:branched-chain amino acid transport system substrate-binding protein